MKLITKNVGIVAKGAVLSALEVSPGQTYYTDITTENSTGSSQTKDFLAAFGSYDAGTGEFTMAWGNVAINASIPTGTATNSVTCQATGMGTFDVMGAIGVFDEGAGTFTIESAVVLEDALSVTGVAVTGISLHL